MVARAKLIQVSPFYLRTAGDRKSFFWGHPTWSVTGRLTLLAEQGVKREGVGTKFSETLAGFSDGKLMLASFLFATGEAQPLQVAHDFLVSVSEVLRIDVQRDKHFLQQFCGTGSVARKLIKIP